MRRVSQRALFVAVACAFLGCGGHVATSTQAGGSLFVEEVLAPQPGTNGYTDDPAQSSIPSGVLDVARHPQYGPTYLLGSQFVPGSGTGADVTTVQGAKVRITDASGNQVNTLSALASVTIYPVPGGTVGYAPLTLTTLDATSFDGAMQNNLAAGGTTRLVTYVTFFGQTTGGVEVHSDEFAFPVDVCRGCLSDAGD
jgi:hypothetical protein